MPKVTLLESTIVVALAFTALLIFQFPSRPQMLVYPLIRQLAQARQDYQTRNMEFCETPHFIIKYSEPDADVVELVAKAAEKAYQPVTRALDYSPPPKTIIVIYPNKQAMNKVFGWSGSQSAMGVYWGGVIQVLSPHDWLKNMTAAEFIHSGPIVHEFTHLVFDYRTDGNYPRWFTEGLAQYVEYQVNGYEWRTASNSLTGNLYSMSELDDNFDRLPDQSLAYRESLAAVRYIATEYGEDKLRQLLGDLESGRNIKQAVGHTLGMDYRDYAKAWQKWAAANMDGDK